MRRCIESKRLGNELAPAVWEDIVAGYVAGTVDDAQMAAMAMACNWRGLTVEEAAAMTRAMVASGETLSYPDGITVVDKHSSGGVGDIISLIAVPIVAACGTRVAKLSGRAPGHTGGTIDKLEIIPGFNVSLAMDAFVRQVESVGCAIAAQTDAFVPADKRLYKLRDRTGHGPEPRPIASSIVSKKVAGGAHALSSTSCGEAAFMQKPRRHRAGRGVGRHLATVRPCARARSSRHERAARPSIGTGVEIVEARQFLRGEIAIPRVKALCMQIAEAMLDLAGLANGADDIQRALDGAAYEKFCERSRHRRIGRGHGGDAEFAARHRRERAASGLRARDRHRRARQCGARAQRCGTRWPGIRINVHEGESVGAGDMLAEIFSFFAGPGVGGRGLPRRRRCAASASARLRYGVRAGGDAPPKNGLLASDSHLRLRSLFIDVLPRRPSPVSS